ncbi:DUF1643 domain-containing protein [Nonomuraea wenchangensis]|uniref:DUF1643 domain-containing protein n=1 Tax=Nonomuraea wenchangensis TaxID=568860 RepID=UPI003CCC41AB
MAHHTLCAVLLNPPVGTPVQTPTYKNLVSALSVIGCDLLEVVNLLDIPSKGLDALGDARVEVADIMRSREAIEASMGRAHELLFAWGTSVVRGRYANILAEQIAWVHRLAHNSDIREVWMLAGDPRHPSRWRQYVGPQKGRISGNTFEERLAKALVRYPLTSTASYSLRPASTALSTNES